MSEGRDDREPETWVGLRIKDIASIMEKRRLEGEKRRDRFRDKMADLKERYEKIMERRIERMRKNGIDITLAGFRNRIDPEALKVTRNMEEEEYKKLFLNESTDEQKDYDARDHEDVGNHSDSSEIDSDREVVDCEIYGIPGRDKSEIVRPSINLLRPTVTDVNAESSSLDKLRTLMKGQSSFGLDISILRPTIQETNIVEEPPQEEHTEPDTMTDIFQTSVKTIKLKHKAKKHHHSHAKPKLTKTNSQANFKKTGIEAGNNIVDGKPNGNPALLENFLRQNPSGDLLEPKERLRKASAKLRVLKAMGGTFQTNSKVETQFSSEAETTKQSVEKSVTTNSFSVQAKSVLKKRASRLLVHNDSQGNQPSK